jgi:hypothetical protein
MSPPTSFIEERRAIGAFGVRREITDYPSDNGMGLAFCAELPR